MRPCAKTLASELTQEELEHLLQLLGESELKDRHLEVGTAAGGTLWQLMNVYKKDARPQFVVVDPMKYFPKQLETVKNNLSLHNIEAGCVDFRVMSSKAAFVSAEKRKESYDLIFIDGAHKVRYVTEDLKWARLLNKGGLLVLHDFAPQYRGVWYSVNRFLKKNPHYSIVEQVDKLITLKKNEKSRSKEISLIDKLLSLILSPIFQLESSIKKRLSP